MLTVRYDPLYGNVVPDGHVAAYVNGVVARMHDIAEDMVTVGSELLINEFRLRVARGVIPHDQIEFMFNEEILPIRPTGKLDEWPHGFCDYGTTQTYELIKLAAKRARARQEANK